MSKHKCPNARFGAKGDEKMKMSLRRALCILAVVALTILGMVTLFIYLDPEHKVGQPTGQEVVQEALKAGGELGIESALKIGKIVRNVRENEQSDCKEAMERMRAGVRNCLQLDLSDEDKLKCVNDNTYMHSALYTGEDPPEQNVWGERREKLTEEKLVEDMILIRGLVRDCLEREGILGGESSRLDCVNIKTYWLTAPYTGEAIPEIMKGGPF
ncbi:MAG: hypothetical protein ABIJ23_05140 [Candidatus Magasanikbacteria bacterium]